MSTSDNHVSFSGLVLGFSSAALYYLGETPLEGKSSSNQLNLELAKQNIDLLDLLREKTAGNLTKEEQHLLEQVLTDLRLKYVGAKKA